MYVWPWKNCEDPDTDVTYAVAGQGVAHGSPVSGGPPTDLGKFLIDRLPRQAVLLPGDAGYDDRRKTFNPRFDDIHPAAVVLCTGEGDVRVCLDAVRTLDIPFRIRARGHSLCGFSSVDGGLVIDLSGMNRIQIDDAAMEAVVQSGSTLKALGDQLNDRGFMLPLGGDPVGVAGFVQGGGFGTTSRTFGMHSDHVVSIRVMLSDGSVVRASETRNHDLWWACRGGTGGNFGVLLEVRYRLHPLAERHSWSMSWRVHGLANQNVAVRALLAWQNDVVLSSGPELNTGADLRYWPDADGAKPSTMRLSIYGTYFGTAQEASDAVQPLAKIEGQESFDRHFYRMLPVVRQSRLVSGPTKQGWESIVGSFVEKANPYSTLTVDAWGGMINAYPPERSAFIHRTATFNIYATGFWSDTGDEQQMRAYLSAWRENVAPFWNGGIYQNFADSDCPAFTLNYWGKAYPALVAVKRKYDPSCRFKFAQMISVPGESAPPVSWPPLVKKWLEMPIEP